MAPRPDISPFLPLDLGKSLKTAYPSIERKDWQTFRTLRNSFKIVKHQLMNNRKVAGGRGNSLY